MSRATEIALAIIILQASIGFTDAVGMFDTTYTAPTDNNATYVISDLSAFDNTGDQDLFSMAAAGLDFLISTFLIGLKIVFAIIFIYPTLVTTFSIPAAISAFVQAGVYFIYATWYAQYKSGRSWEGYNI